MSGVRNIASEVPERESKCVAPKSQGEGRTHR